MKLSKCETCGQSVDIWTAYYWLSKSKKWECLSCIYRDRRGVNNG